MSVLYVCESVLFHRWAHLCTWTVLIATFAHPSCCLPLTFNIPAIMIFKVWLWLCLVSLGCVQNKMQTPSVQFIHSVVSNSLWPHGPQHARPLCPSPAPRACSDSCPLSRWFHPTISSCAVPFSSCLQSFQASGSFQMFDLVLNICKLYSFTLHHTPWLGLRSSWVFSYRWSLNYSLTYNFFNFAMCKSDVYSLEAVLQILNVDLFPGWWYVVLSSLAMLGSGSSQTAMQSQGWTTDTLTTVCTETTIVFFTFSTLFSQLHGILNIIKWTLC